MTESDGPLQAKPLKPKAIEVEIGDEEDGVAPGVASTLRGDSAAVGVDEPSFFQHLPQFVIFPLIVVIIAVGIVVFFRASVEESRPIAAILDDLQSGWRKGQPAFDLAIRARELEEEGKKLGDRETRRLVQILGRTEDPRLRTFLLEALGRAGSEAVALDVLIRIIGSSTDNEQERINTILGLGLSRSPRAVEPLVRELEKARGDGHWELRLNILLALANIAGGLDHDTQAGPRSAVQESFRRCLQDPEWTVSWNAAITLATDFRDPAGLRIVRQLLQPEFLARHVKSHHQAAWIARAIDALAELEDVDSQPVIESLEEQAVSPKVQNAAFKYLNRVKDASIDGRAKS